LCSPARQPGPLSQAQPLLPWRFRGRCGESDRAIFLINGRTNRLERRPFFLHRHHVTRDVLADVSERTVAREGNGLSREAFGHIAIGVVPVANRPTAADAGDVLENLSVFHRIAVDCLDLRPAFAGKGRGVPPVAPFAAGHRSEFFAAAVRPPQTPTALASHQTQRHQAQALSVEGSVFEQSGLSSHHL